MEVLSIYLDLTGFVILVSMLSGHTTNTYVRWWGMHSLVCMWGIHHGPWNWVNRVKSMGVWLARSPSKDNFGSLTSNPSFWLLMPYPSSFKDLNPHCLHPFCKAAYLLDNLYQEFITVIVLIGKSGVDSCCAHS